MNLEYRLLRLERQNRWFKCAAIAAAGLFVTLGQSKPQDEITARKFTLVDDKGKQMGVWEIMSGAATLSLKGKKDKQIILNGDIVLSQDQQGRTLSFTNTGLRLSGNNGEIMLNIHPETGQPSLRFGRNDGVIKIEISPVDGSSILVRSGPENVGPACLLNANKESVLFRAGDKKGTVSMGSVPQIGPYLMITDPAQDILFSAP